MVSGRQYLIGFIIAGIIGAVSGSKLHDASVPKPYFLAGAVVYHGISTKAEPLHGVVVSSKCYSSGSIRCIYRVRWDGYLNKIGTVQEGALASKDTWTKFVGGF